MNWKIALALTALVTTVAALGACGHDECSSADAELVSCAMPTMTSSSSSGMAMAQACVGVHQCQSRCINQFTCAQINGNQPAFKACMLKCQGQ